MKYATEIIMKVSPANVFAALHQYKVNRKPSSLFGAVLPAGIVKIDFKVLTDNTLGLGAIYEWKFRFLGITVLKFREKIIEWTEGISVSYQAISGWKMFFRTELEPITEGTCLKTQIEFSPFGNTILDQMFAPVVRWGLNKVNNRLKKTVELIFPD